MRQPDAKDFREWRGNSFYERWQEKEGVPIYRGHFIEDLYNLQLGPWERLGGQGAFLNLGEQQDTDGYVTEISPGGSLKVEHHLFEEIIFVLDGQGATMAWQEGGKRETFEWGRGSLFAIPLNSWHQHFNGSAKGAVRLLAYTNAPSQLNRYHNENFIFQNPFVFADRYGGEEGYFRWEGQSVAPRIWETNFVRDVRAFPLASWTEKGSGARHMRFAMADNILGCHIHEIQEGTYVQAHRHMGGSLVLILEGSGYELMWMEREERKRYELKPGTLICPGQMMYHQHLNPGIVPVRQLALRGYSPKWSMGKAFREIREEDLIRYEDEDPEVKTMFEREVKKAKMRP